MDTAWLPTDRSSRDDSSAHNPGPSCGRHRVTSTAADEPMETVTRKKRCLHLIDPNFTEGVSTGHRLEGPHPCGCRWRRLRLVCLARRREEAQTQGVRTGGARAAVPERPGRSGTRVCCEAGGSHRSTARSSLPFAKLRTDRRPLLTTRTLARDVCVQPEDCAQSSPRSTPGTSSPLRPEGAPSWGGGPREDVATPFALSSHADHTSHPSMRSQTRVLRKGLLRSSPGRVLFPELRRLGPAPRVGSVYPGITC